MILALALVLIATAAGAISTYLYDEEAPPPARLCAGACTGLAALGLSGFVFASFLGLTLLALALSAAAVAAPLLLLGRAELRRAVSRDVSDSIRAARRAVLHPSLSETAYLVSYLLIAVLLWLVFDRAYFELPDGFYTGVQNNYGDLPFHLGVITSFARGENFPPQDPTFAGVRFTYPFLADFVAAMFARAGASLRDAMFIENFVLALSFIGLLHRWTLMLVRDRLAAVLAPVLVLFSGGLGWVRFLREVRQSQMGLFSYLFELRQQYTISGTTWRWGNALTTLLVPQRSILFGLPLALIVFTLFWQKGRDEETEGREDSAKEGERTKKGKHAARKARKQAEHKRVHTSTRPRISRLQRMIAAGLIAGLLPLIHAHSLMVVMLVGGLLAVLREEWRAWAVGISALALLAAGLAFLSASAQAGEVSTFFLKTYVVCAVVALAGAAFFWLWRGPERRQWLTFFIVATLIAAPQMWWIGRGSSVEATSFIGWHFGWDHGNESIWRFWLKNTGLFIPLLLAALLWLKPGRLIPKRLLFYYLPFALWFIIPNLVLLAPWVWDNIKVLFYWYVASVPLVALLLARLWRSRLWLRATALALLLGLTLAGALDVWSVVASSESKILEFDRAGVKFAESVEQRTRPRALILHAPTFNHPIFLTGRQSLMGYPGHIWTHGLKYQEREALIRHLYAGGHDAASLIEEAGIEYVVVGPPERQLMPVNELFFLRYPVAFEMGAYRLYRTSMK